MKPRAAKPRGAPLFFFFWYSAVQQARDSWFARMQGILAIKERCSPAEVPLMEKELGGVEPFWNLFRTSIFSHGYHKRKEAFDSCHAQKNCG